MCVCRDHPSLMKRRVASVLLVSALSPAVVKAWMHWAEVKVRTTKHTSLCISLLFYSPVCTGSLR